MNKNFLALTASNYPCKRLDIRFGYVKIPSKGGNKHLDFRNSLLKYDGNNFQRRKYTFKF